MLRIYSVIFQDSDHRYGDKEVIATMEDGSTKFVFAWFSDELQFTRTEFLGLTIDQARDLKQARDVAYLRS